MYLFTRYFFDHICRLSASWFTELSYSDIFIKCNFFLALGHSFFSNPSYHSFNFKVVEKLLRISCLRLPRSYATRAWVKDKYRNIIFSVLTINENLHSTYLAWHHDRSRISGQRHSRAKLSVAWCINSARCGRSFRLNKTDRKIYI